MGKSYFTKLLPDIKKMGLFDEKLDSYEKLLCIFIFFKAISFFSQDLNSYRNGDPSNDDEAGRIILILAVVLNFEPLIKDKVFNKNLSDFEKLVKIEHKAYLLFPKKDSKKSFFIIEKFQNSKIKKVKKVLKNITNVLIELVKDCILETFKTFVSLKNGIDLYDYEKDMLDAKFGAYFCKKFEALFKQSQALQNEFWDDLGDDFSKFKIGEEENVKKEKTLEFKKIMRDKTAEISIVYREKLEELLDDIEIIEKVISDFCK